LSVALVGDIVMVTICSLSCFIRYLLHLLPLYFLIWVGRGLGTLSHWHHTGGAIGSSNTNSAENSWCLTVYSRSVSLLQVPAYSEAATPAACIKHCEVSSGHQCCGISCDIRGIRHIKRRWSVFQHQKFIVQKSSVRWKIFNHISFITHIKN